MNHSNTYLGYHRLQHQYSHYLYLLSYLFPYSPYLHSFIYSPYSHHGNTPPIVSISSYSCYLCIHLILMSPLISFFYSFFNTNCIHLDCPIVHTLISLSFILCLGTGMCSVSSLLHLRSSLCHMCHIPNLVLLLGMCPVFCVMCTFSYLILLSN